MKIRIRGNFVRFRLTQSEVKEISEKGLYEEKTVFGPGPDDVFTYRLQAQAGITQLQATFAQNTITMMLPADEAKTWHGNAKVGFENMVDNGTNNPLQLLLEKDFACLDETVEDQSDNYPNPLAHLHK